MSQKQVREALDYDLKQNKIAENQQDDGLYSNEISLLMQTIENQRKDCMKNAPQEYTQKRLAEKGGISLSSYRSYINEDNNDMKIKTLLKLTNALGMKCSITLEPFNKKLSDEDSVSDNK